MSDGLTSELICLSAGLKERDPFSLPGLTLAFIGDCVYEIVVRTTLVEQGKSHVNALNRESTSIVNAKAQAKLMEAIEPLLSEEELTIYKRGRNASGVKPPKSATPHEYRVATGFEALVGFLYLKGRSERIMELVGKRGETV